MLFDKPGLPPDAIGAEPPPRGTALLSIADAERACGVPKETLRVWERRYGFPRPLRDAGGDRQYPADQVARLQDVRRALSLGHRPARVLALEPAELHRLAGAAPAAAPSADAAPDFRTLWLPVLRLHDPVVLRRVLQREVGRHGLRGFVNAVLAPALRGLGEAWHHGEVQVFEEHLFTQAATHVLGAALAGVPPPRPDGARVLLTTLPREQHGLGLLMSEVLLSLDGASCHALGLQTPVAQIAEAAGALRSDIVLLGCSPCVDARRVRAELIELRRLLPVGVALWAGGSAPVLRRCGGIGVRHLASLEALVEALAQWRGPARGARG
jgi:hypothetical protein